MPPFVVTIIDTPVFQRLRYLRQNGLLHLVFPGAVHTRFAHSIGTAWLAYNLMLRLREIETVLAITTGEVNTVVTAALCHDLGHGPCSHAFDMFMEHIDATWSHEMQSVTLLLYMVDTFPDVKAALDRADVDVHVVCELILGSRDTAPKKWKWKGPAAGRHFLYEIVSCSPPGIDVDKWDDIRRDSYYLNIPNGFVCKRLLKRCRVIEGSLAWPRDEISTIMDMFHTRFQLHDKAYQHCESRLIDRMVMQALFLMKDYAVGVCGVTGAPVAISNAYQHPDIYTRLTDTIVDCGLQDVLDTARISADARFLYSLVQHRKLWPLAGEAYLPKTFSETMSDIGAAISKIAGVSDSEFCIDIAHINCGKGRRNPMKNVRIFSGTIDTVLPMTDMEYLKPSSFQKRVLRIFAVNSALFTPISDAFLEWKTEKC